MRPRGRPRLPRWPWGGPRAADPGAFPRPGAGPEAAAAVEAGQGWGGGRRRGQAPRARLPPGRRPRPRGAPGPRYLCAALAERARRPRHARLRLLQAPTAAAQSGPAAMSAARCIVGRRQAGAPWGRRRCGAAAAAGIEPGTVPAPPRPCRGAPRASEPPPCWGGDAPLSPSPSAFRAFLPQCHSGKRGWGNKQHIFVS